MDVKFFIPAQAAQQIGQLTYGAVSTALGWCYAATFNNVLCYLALSVVNSADFDNELKRRWPKAQHQSLSNNNPELSSLVERVLNRKIIPLILVGTDFQQHIWRTLLKIPAGSKVSYQTLAAQAQKPKAIRAAASALANNLIAVAVPCHRVIRASGELGQYRWGVDLKRRLLAEEGCGISR